jgi:peptide/nickel transport system substrate-binding protein
MRIVPDENAAFTLLKSGELDLYQSAAIGQYEALKKLKHVEVQNAPALVWELIAFNCKRPFLADKRVRQAIAYAVNKKQISDKIYQGLYTPAYSDQAPLSWGYNKKLEQLYPYDPDKANRLLDEAGWKKGLDGVRVKDGKRLELKITTTTGRKPRELTELVLKYYLKQIGVELGIDNVPGTILFGPAPDGTLKGGKYDLGMYAWSSAPDPDTFSLWHSSQIPPKGQNNTFFSNPELDRLLEAGTKVLKRSDRIKIYYRAQEILAENLPAMPLLYWCNLNPINKRIKNFKPNPSNDGNLWNVYEWEIDEKAPAIKAEGGASGS